MNDKLASGALVIFSSLVAGFFRKVDLCRVLSSSVLCPVSNFHFHEQHWRHMGQCGNKPFFKLTCTYGSDIACHHVDDTVFYHMLIFIIYHVHAVRTGGGRQNEDNRRAIPVSPLQKSVVDALAFDMIRGDSDSNKL